MLDTLLLQYTYKKNTKAVCGTSERSDNIDDTHFVRISINKLRGSIDVIN